MPSRLGRTCVDLQPTTRLKAHPKRQRPRCPPCGCCSRSGPRLLNCLRWRC